MVVNKYKMIDVIFGTAYKSGCGRNISLLVQDELVKTNNHFEIACTNNVIVLCAVMW